MASSDTGGPRVAVIGGGLVRPSRRVLLFGFFFINIIIPLMTVYHM